MKTRKQEKTIFRCQHCGYTTPKWLGKCPDCGQWHTFDKEVQKTGASGRASRFSTDSNQPVALDEADISEDQRIFTGIGEFDRVLGGGLVPGSLVLIGGDPGIGKSTLMLQVLHGLSVNGLKTLYVSGEESIRQILLRGKRLGTVHGNMWVVSEVDVDAILDMIQKEKPDVVVVDSIQTMYSGSVGSAPGSVTQVRETAVQFMFLAKKTAVPTFLVGHVTKEGAIAGPRLLEHMVDTVLYFEGDRSHMFRILRTVKNRFGSTNEIGVFEMKDKGLAEVPNPSAVFLSERPYHVAGSVVTASMEGTRPILVELQALVTGSGFATPRRTVLGLDHNRVALLAAVMEKKMGLFLREQDIFMNVAGGVKVDEPALDMGIICAVASSLLDIPVPEGHVVLGEIGLTGEVRAVSHMDIRLAEIRKMGFQRCFIPSGNIRMMSKSQDIEVIGISDVSQVMESIFHA